MPLHLDLARGKAKMEARPARLRLRRGRARAAFALVVLLGALGLPLLGLVLAGEHEAFSCGKGRCCCSGEAAGQGDRSCLRRSCGCGHEDATPAGEPLRIEAVLPEVGLPAVPEPDRGPRAGAGESPLARPHAPPVPPPRRSFPA
jgi:hypothetical protein